MSIGYESGKCTLAVQDGILGGHKCAPFSHKHMLSHPSFSSPLRNEDLPAGPQLVFTLNNRFFRHQACYSLLPAKTGGQADRVVSLCKYKVVGLATSKILTPHPPLLPASVSSPRNKGGGCTLAGRRGGWGVNILEDARHRIGLLQ